MLSTEPTSRAVELGGADDRDRTGILSLGSSCSTIELHPHGRDRRGVKPRSMAYGRHCSDSEFAFTPDRASGPGFHLHRRFCISSWP